MSGLSFSCLPRFLCLAFPCLVLLTGCASVLDRSLQHVQVETPGAQNAQCDVVIDGFRHSVRPPQTVQIRRTPSDMEISCQAPGNRVQQVVISPEIHRSVGWNILNGLLPGTTYDYHSGAMFRYPERVIVDFTGIDPLPNPLPAPHSYDIPPPRLRGLETFRSGWPALDSDSDRVLPPLEKRALPENTGESTPDSPLPLFEPKPLK